MTPKGQQSTWIAVYEIGGLDIRVGSQIVFHDCLSMYRLLLFVGCTRESLAYRESAKRIMRAYRLRSWLYLANGEDLFARALLMDMCMIDRGLLQKCR